MRQNQRVRVFEPTHQLPFVLHGFRRRRTNPVPSDAAVYQARTRLGWAPIRYLCRHVRRALATPDRDPGAFYHGRRLLGIDGTTFTVADSPANARTFGRARNKHRERGYPLIRAVAVCELGTHALIDWIARGYNQSENRLARRLLRRVPRGSLVLMDRNFHAFDLWDRDRTGAFDRLIRVQKGPLFPILEAFPDGSYRSRVMSRKGADQPVREIPVRVIEYRWTDAAGTAHDSRLLTSLLDPKTEPAGELVRLYHPRWEEELAFKEVKGQLGDRGTHIRARDPILALAELDALLLGHWVVRGVLVRAAREAGVAPVQVSFVGAVRVLQARLVGVAVGRRGSSTWWSHVLTEIARERLRKRRNRVCPRVRKTVRCHWPVKKKEHTEGTIPTLHVVPVAPAVAG